MCVPHVISWEVAVDQSELWDVLSQSKTWIVFYKTVLYSVQSKTSSNTTNWKYMLFILYIVTYTDKIFYNNVNLLIRYNTMCAQLWGKLYSWGFILFLNKCSALSQSKMLINPKLEYLTKEKWVLASSWEYLCVCTIIRQLLMCQNIMQLNKKLKISSLTHLFSFIRVRMTNKNVKFINTYFRHFNKYSVTSIVTFFAITIMSLPSNESVSFHSLVRGVLSFLPVNLTFEKFLIGFRSGE